MALFWATRAFIATTLVFVLFGLLGLRINWSPSLPIGLYITDAESSTLVEFCPSEPFASLALSRGYRDPGSCSDGGAPLLKPVVARASDLVEVSAAGIAVNGHLLPNTTPLRKDTNGRPLKSWPLANTSFSRVSCGSLLPTVLAASIVVISDPLRSIPFAIT